MLRIETHFEKAAGSVQELKKRSTRSKGNLFEAFCQLYLQATLPNAQVYSLKDVPVDVRTRLRLPGPDLGIDLVAVVPNYGDIAVQCKYRHCTKKRSIARPHGKTLVTYKDLVTFTGLCGKTGPWACHMVMTNCDGASWKGLKTKKDVTLAKGTFKQAGLGVWTAVAGSVGHSLASSPVVVIEEHKVPAPPLSTDRGGDLRAKRAAFLHRVAPSISPHIGEGDKVSK